MDNGNGPSPFIVTHANKHGIQNVVSCNSINEATVILTTTLKELGFTSSCNMTAPNFPVLIWRLNPANRTYEKATFMPKNTTEHHKSSRLPLTVTAGKDKNIEYETTGENRKPAKPHALMLWLMFGALVLYSALDAYQTKLLLDYGMAEANPFLAWMIRASGFWWSIITYKVSALGLLATVIAYTLSPHAKTQPWLSPGHQTNTAQWPHTIAIKTAGEITGNR